LVIELKDVYNFIDLLLYCQNELKLRFYNLALP